MENTIDSENMSIGDYIAMTDEQRWNQMSFEEIANDIIFNGLDGGDQRIKIMRALRNQTLLCADVVRAYSNANPKTLPYAFHEALEKLNRLAGDEIEHEA